jgi:arylsulfatase A-like enzyme
MSERRALTDMFPTLLGFAGIERPSDRLIDGIDQAPFFLGQQETSNRDACMVWLNEELHAVKWRDFNRHSPDDSLIAAETAPIPRL